MRESSLRVVWLCLVASWFLVDHLLLAVAYGPPSLRLPGHDLRKVVSSGKNAVLPCPVRADPATLFVEWFKESRPLTEVGKYRLTPSGSLRIKKVTSQDTAQYTCRAVNGFGSIQIKVFLLVIEKQIDDRDSLESSIPSEVEFTEVAETGGAPRFTFVTSFNGSVVQSSTGGTVRLKCAGTGEPTPKIYWLKNGVRLKPATPSTPASSLTPTDVGDHSTNATTSNATAKDTRHSQQRISVAQPSKIIRKKWSIQLEKLRRTDSGNYTCVLRNPYGSISTSFLLEVIDGTKPEVTGYHPLNTTVEYGSSATFQCRVRSEIPPHIKWLKKLEAKELASLKEAAEGGRRGKNKQQRVIIVQGEPFRFLKSSQVMSKPDGSFLNKLYIREARETDSGKYICVGANSLGYSYRSAFLTVMRRPHTGILNWERTVVLRPGQPDAVMIGIPITVGVLVGVVVALAILCHSRRAREISARATTIWTNPNSASPALKSVEQQTSFSSFPPPNFKVVTKEEFLGSTTETDSFGGLAYPSSLCETTTVSSYKPQFFNTEAVYQERSVVAKLHDCSPKDRYDCFFLRDNV